MASDHSVPPTNCCLPGGNTALLRLDFVLSAVFYFFLTNCPFTVSFSVFFHQQIPSELWVDFVPCSWWKSSDLFIKIPSPLFSSESSSKLLLCHTIASDGFFFFFNISIFLILIGILTLKDQLLCWHQHFNCYNGSWIPKWGFALSKVPGIFCDTWAV